MEILAWFLVRGNTTHTHDFCMLLVFLGIKDYQKNKKRTNFFSKAIGKATATLIEILYFFCLIWTVLTLEFGRLKRFEPQGHKGQKGQHKAK